MNPAWIALAEHRDTRIIAEPPIEACNMTALLVWTKNQLRNVAKSGVDVDSLVQMDGRKNGARTLLCGDRKVRKFIRTDGIQCNFMINVMEQANTLTLLSYTLHLDAPIGHPAPPFLRWEFEQEHRKGVNAIKEPLSHLHPGHNHIRAPSPVLSPKELILLVLSIELWA